MSPIIELQRRMVEAGRIRAGDQAATQNGTRPRKLDKWRLTSKDQVRLAAAADLWGGEVKPWDARPGEFELYTDTASLPIMLLPGQMPTTWFELWSKGGCQRRCDGVHELISDSACLCGEERECKPTTRLSVLLPDLPGLGSWMLSSTGWNAAAELAGAADLLQRASAQGVLIPARLRLEQRHEVKQGETRRFAVPVIDLDVSMRQLLGAPTFERPALPSGYQPLRSIDPGVSLEDGLKQTEKQTVTRGARSAEPIAPAPDDLEFGAAPVAVPADESVGEPTAAAAVAATVPPAGPDDPKPASPTDRTKPTGAQAKKMNTLVGRLRDAGAVSTEQMWAALAKARNLPVDDMIELLSGRDEEGALHWSPLRESLSRDEASRLIDWLEKHEAKAGAAA